jgi:pyruvate kinase
VKRLAPDRDVFGRVTRAARIGLVAATASETPPIDVSCTLRVEGDLLGAVASGDHLELTDTRGQSHDLHIREAHDGSVVAEIARTAYIEEGTAVTAVRDGTIVAEGRIVGIPEVIEPILLHAGDTLILTRSDEPGSNAERDEAGQVIEPAHIHCTLDAAFDQVAHGHRIWLDDGKIGGLVQENDGERIRVRITHTGPQGAKLRAEKGINFPDSPLAISALTEKDLDDLTTVVTFADMVALSFVRGPEDVERLHD